FKKQLTKMASNGMFFTVSLKEDRERKAYLPTLTMMSHGVESFYRFSYEFFAANDYQEIVSLGKEIQGLLEEGAFVQRNEKKLQVNTFKEALAWLMEEA